MTALPRVPLDSNNERQHRTVIATATNELIKVRPPNDRTEAEVSAGVTPTDYGYIDVRRFGVVGDSTTDDTDAFQRAVDVCQAGGFAVHIPRGLTVRLTGTITYDDAIPCVIIGEGSGGIEAGDSRIVVDSGGDVGITNDQGGGQKPLIMRNIGMFAASSTSAGHLVHILNTNGVIIENCRFSQTANRSADCIRLEGCIYFTLRDVRVGRCRYGVAIVKESGGNACSGYHIDKLSHFGESTWSHRILYIDGGEGVITQPNISVVGSGGADATFGIYIQKNAALSEAGNIVLIHPDTEDTGAASYGSGSTAIYVEGMTAITMINPAAADSSANYSGMQFHDCDACQIIGGFLDAGITLSGTTRNFTVQDAFADTNYTFTDSSTGTGNKQIRIKRSSGRQINEGRSFALQFEEVDVTGTTGGQVLQIAGSSGCTEYTVPFDCCIVGIAVASNAARTAGTATFEPRKNGSATGVISAVLDGTNTQYAYDTAEVFESANLEVAAGDRLSVRMVTSGFTPTTADVAVTLYLQE